MVRDMRICYALVLLVVFTTTVCVAEEALKNKRILFINSYAPSFPTSERRLEGLMSVLGNKQITLDIEYMDSKRHPDEVTQKQYLALLKQKLKSRPGYDVIITSDDNALHLAMRYGEELFPQVPIVFHGLNNQSLGLQLNDHPNITGVIESVSVAGTLDLIASINSKRNKLHVIVDSTPSGKEDLKRVVGLEPNFPQLEFHYIYLSNLTWEQYKDELRKLNDDDAILLLSAFKDKNDQTVLFRETLSILKRYTNVPIYHLWEHGLGQGILGGLLINHYEQARESALMAEKIISGIPVSEIPVLMESTNRPMFDYTQLIKNKISLNDIPIDSEVLYKPETIFDKYRYELTILLIVFLFLFLVALYLGSQTVLRTKLAEEANKQTNFLRRLMNALPDLIYLKDLEGKYLACNRRFESLYGLTEKEIVGKTVFDLLTKDKAEFFTQKDSIVLRDNDHIRYEIKMIFSDGHEELLETIKAPLEDANGKTIGIIGISRDITERADNEKTIKTLMQAVEHSPVSVAITDLKGKIEYVNNSFEKISGFSNQEVLGESLSFMQADSISKENYKLMWSTLDRNKSWEGELYNKRKNGECFWEYAYMSPIIMEDNSVVGYLSVKEDITLRREQEEKIRFQAHFDSLTKLPNRSLSQDRLQQMINGAQRSRTKVGVLYMDLDDFKKVNDTLGHSTGDQLLEQVSRRLVRSIREQDTVGRLGGDEFIVLLNDIQDIGAGSVVAKNLINELEKPIVIDNRQIMIAASVGIAIFPDDGNYPEELMRKADLAMYNAKNNGGSQAAFYTSELNEKVERRFLVEQQLRGALNRKEFYIEYQPKIELKTERVMGLEALLRWRNPTLGNVSPVEFIPIAEQTGAITAIGYYVFESVLKMYKSIASENGKGMCVSINLSPRQFRDYRFASKIFSLVEKYDVKPSDVEFEITEGLFIEEQFGVKETLNKLHDAGIKLSMDDFGTGYSSLSYLRHYPFDTIKVDREFVQGITENQADRELVYAAISMAHSLNLKVVAEGVETEHQKMILSSLTCDIVQGFLYSKPVSGTQIQSTLNFINQQ